MAGEAEELCARRKEAKSFVEDVVNLGITLCFADPGRSKRVLYEKRRRKEEGKRLLLSDKAVLLVANCFVWLGYHRFVYYFCSYTEL